MPGIFISYRRTDTQGDARDLAERLEKRFGPDRVFRDIGDIPPGAGWQKVIHDTLAQYNVVLVLIGEHWLDASNQKGRRLDDPEDTLRQEVAGALRSDSLVIPVLFRKVEMPQKEALPDELQKLTDRNEHRITDLHYKEDVDRLIQEIEKHVRPRLRIPGWVASIPVLLLALIAWQFVPGLPKPPWVPTTTPMATLPSTPVPTAILAATATRLPPTPTVVPTDTPLLPTPTDVPTNTPVPPTPTVAPTDTPLSPTDTPTPVPTPGLVQVQAAAIDQENIVRGNGTAGSHTWAPYTVEANKGCFGEELSAIQAFPTTGGDDALQYPNGPAAYYYTPLVPARYYLYVRGWAEHDYQDAVFVSWQAAERDTPTLLTGEKGLKFYRTELNWQPGQDQFLDQAPIVVEVKTNGTHTFILRMRKPGLVVKDLLLSPKKCDFTTYPCDVEKACGVTP